MTPDERIVQLEADVKRLRGREGRAARLVVTLESRLHESQDEVERLRASVHAHIEDGLAGSDALVEALDRAESAEAASDPERRLDGLEFARRTQRIIEWGIRLSGGNVLPINTVPITDDVRDSQIKAMGAAGHLGDLVSRTRTHTDDIVTDWRLHRDEHPTPEHGDRKLWAASVRAARQQDEEAQG